MRSMILGSLLALGLAFSFGAARAAPDQGEFTIRLTMESGHLGAGL